jgi:hypothetical protein
MAWRAARRRGERVDTSRARALFQVNHVQMALVIVMIFVASAVAHGVG